MTAAEYQEYLRTGKLPGEKPKRNKYHAQKTDGYDSKKEAERAGELQMMKLTGEIVQVFEQVPFEVAKDIKYVADFVILKPDGTWYVEDAKGVKTDVYKLKKKLFREKYGMEIVEV